MIKNMSLATLKEGQQATVENINLNGAISRRLLDLGLIEGTKVTCLQKSPYGDPIAYLIRGAVIALRFEDSSAIMVR